MQKLSQTVHDNGGIRRCVQEFQGGIRRVVHDYYGESWTSYLIIPRQLLVDGIRQRRANGAQYHDCDWWTLIPGIGRWISPASHGNPGQSFAREPYRIGPSRRFLVIAQSGGLDI